MKFKKRPEEVDAVKFNGKNTDDILKWINKPGKEIAKVRSGKLMIHTQYGFLETAIGDWVVCDTKGEFYPCRPSIFHKTYEVTAT